MSLERVESDSPGIKASKQTLLKAMRNHFDLIYMYMIAMVTKMIGHYQVPQSYPLFVYRKVIHAKALN